MDLMWWIELLRVIGALIEAIAGLVVLVGVAWTVLSSGGAPTGSWPHRLILYGVYAYAAAGLLGVPALVAAL